MYVRPAASTVTEKEENPGSRYIHWSTFCSQQSVAQGQ